MTELTTGARLVREWRAFRGKDDASEAGDEALLKMVDRYLNEERDACAKLAEEYPHYGQRGASSSPVPRTSGGADIAVAIRQRYWR